MATTQHATMDFEQARFNMVEQQIRPWDVLDPKVLDLLFQVKREQFVPAPYQALAFADLEVPIGEGQSMLPPRVEAKLLQETTIKKTDRVLEIGTGCGYQTAVLAQVVGHVYSVERILRLQKKAQADLWDLKLKNISLIG